MNIHLSAAFLITAAPLTAQRNFSTSPERTTEEETVPTTGVLMGFAFWGSHRSLKESAALEFGHVDMKAVPSLGFMSILASRVVGLVTTLV